MQMTETSSVTLKEAEDEAIWYLISVCFEETFQSIRTNFSFNWMIMDIMNDEFL